MLRRVLTYRVQVRPATPRLRRAFWWLLALWPLVNLADLVTTVPLTGRPGLHEGDPFMAAVLARGGLLAALADNLIVTLVAGTVAVIAWHPLPR